MSTNSTTTRRAKSFSHLTLAAVAWIAVLQATTAVVGSPYSDLVLSHGPVAYWRLGETSGSTATDIAGSNDGTYHNSVSLGEPGAVLDDANSAADFNGGANSRVQVGSFGVSGTGITILAWFKPAGFGNDHLVSKASSTSDSNIHWALAVTGQSEMSAWIKINGTTRELQSSVSTMSTNVWYFAAVTYDGSTMRLYQNGVQVGSASYSGTVSSNSSVDVALANVPSGAGNRAFNGVLDEAAVFDKALTASQIYDLYLTAGGGLLGRWKLVETSGTTAVDSSTVANNGTYNNGVVLGSAGPYPGAGDKAANFDGNNDFVSISNESRYDLTGPMAVAAWIKVDVFDEENQAIFTKGNDAWALQRDDDNNGLSFHCEDLSNSTVTSSVNVNDGSWHHAVGVYTGSQLQLYIDGVLSKSVNSTGTINTNNRAVRIARSDQGSARNFDGSIHDVQLYSRSLTATEVAKMFGFVGHWKLNQTTGTTATDSTVFGSHGAVNGTAAWTTDCGGTGTFDFNGSTNYVSVPNASHLQLNSALTIAAWIRGDSWGSGDNVDVIVRKGDANPNNYQLAIADGRVALYLDESDTAGIRGNTILVPGQWYHVAATWNGSTAKIFVNGALDNSPAARTGTIGADTRPLLIGGRSGADQFDGMIRDIRLYNRALHDSEIQKLGGVNGYWKFAEGSGTTAADSSGLANNATLSGGATWTTDCAGNHNALLTNGFGGIARTNAHFTPPDVGTVAFWMRSSGSPAGTARIFGVAPAWEALQRPDGTVSFDLCSDSTSDMVTTIPLDEAGRWYHVAATFDSNDDTYAIYVDGVLNKSGTNSAAMHQQPANFLSFGTRTGSADYWQGALRDFRVYSRKLCPTEIAELCGAGGYWKLDETSGTVAADSSGSGRHGTVIGTANWTAGQVDNSLQLNGSTRVEINSLMGSPRNVTLAAWANLTAPDTNGAEIASLGDYFAIRLNDGGASRAFFYNGSSWVSAGVSQGFAGAGWHHFAAVFNDDQNWCKLYIDGVEAASVSTTVSIPYVGLGTKTVIGAHGNGQTNYDFSGKIDDVRVYGRALCPTEIQALHDMGTGAFGGVKIIKWVEIQ